MANSKKELKAYCRVDGSQRIVPSSLILRKSKPKVGKWVEVPAYQCCGPTTTTTTTADNREVVPEPTTTTSTSTARGTTTTTTSHA